MSLLKKLFGSKAVESRQGDPPLESLANLFGPEEHETQGDYNLASTISGGIDSITADMGPNALDNTTITLNNDGDVGVVYAATSFKPSKDIKSFFCLKDYDKIQLLKHSAGKQDDLSYMTVDIAGREILSKLKEQ